MGGAEGDGGDEAGVRRPPKHGCLLTHLCQLTLVPRGDHLQKEKKSISREEILHVGEAKLGSRGGKNFSRGRETTCRRGKRAGRGNKNQSRRGKRGERGKKMVGGNEMHGGGKECDVCVVCMLSSYKRLGKQLKKKRKNFRTKNVRLQVNYVFGEVILFVWLSVSE